MLRRGTQGPALQRDARRAALSHGFEVFDATRRVAQDEILFGITMDVFVYLLPLVCSWQFLSLVALLLAVVATGVLISHSNSRDAAHEKNAVTAALTGFINSCRKSAPPRPLPRSSYADKVVLVTGANTGLGFGIAQRLAELQCTVIVACRSNADATAASLRAATGNPNVTSLSVDLSDAQSVVALADTLLAQRRTINCAVLNAAVLTTSST